MLLSLKPDVVTLDVVMPGVDGLWALEEIMKQRPTPVIIFSSLATRESEVTSEAFSLGVVDVLAKPDNPQNVTAIQKELAEKIKAASRINRARLLDYKSVVAKEKTPSQLSAHQVLVVATSAGGPSSLYEVIPRLSKEFYGAVVVAQHMPPQFINSFVGHVQTMTPMAVKIAEKGDILHSRRILFSPTNATLEVRRARKGALADIVDYHVRLQPDINKVVISCAEAFRSSMVLVVLSGLGDDGVKGAEVVKKYGGKVIVEDESTAGVYSGMPSSVVKSGFYDLLCPSYNIAAAAEDFLARRPYSMENKKQFMVKGIILRNAAQFIKNKHSPEALNSVMAALDAGSKGVINENIKQYNYYASDLYYDFYANIFKQLGKEKPKIIEEIAFENARESLTTYKAALTLNGVEDLKNFMQVFSKILFPGIAAEVLDISQEMKQASCLLRSDGFREQHLKITEMTTRGWTNYLFTLLGLAVTENNVETGKDEKGFYSKCLVKWK
ncbi:MAG: chemotaxis protein CheB, partial [Endomicrobiales bacterium]